MGQTSATFGYQDVDPADKPRLVRGVFDRVARRYDLMNDLMSGGVHRLWKDMTAARLNPQPGERIVDCAGGTGDIARRLAKLARQAQARRGGEDAEILVVDYNAEMIGAGRARGAAADIAWAVGDAQRLPLPDACAHQVVHQVVAGGDPVEYAAHEAGLFVGLDILEAEGGAGSGHGGCLAQEGRARHVGYGDWPLSPCGRGWDPALLGG